MVLNISTGKGPFIVLDLMLLVDFRWLWSLDPFLFYLIINTVSLLEFSCTDICSGDIMAITLVVYCV